jgi:hypothetical protein
MILHFSQMGFTEGLTFIPIPPIGLFETVSYPAALQIVRGQLNQHPSPGKMRMKFMRIFPETWANILWPFFNSTRNMAFGRGSTTFPSTSMASFFLDIQISSLPLPGEAAMSLQQSGYFGNS